MSSAGIEIERINFIDRLLSKGLHLSPEDIAFMMQASSLEGGTSIKTVYRVLKEMKEELHAPIAVDGENRRYYEGGETVVLPGFIAKAENFKLISMVKNLLETIKDTPVYPHAQKLFQELSLAVPEEKAASRVIFLGAPAANVKNEVWETIFKAMENNNYISIEYEVLSTGEVIKRGIKPYQLIFDNGLWDLWGYDCIAKQKQQYNLCRIKSIKKRDEVFTLPEDYDFRNETPGTFGCYRDFDTKEMTTYKIHFSKGSYAESFARDRIWGLNSSMEEDETGTVITFQNNQFMPVLRWILGWGSAVHPLAPEKLVTAWKQEVEKMYGELNPSR